MKAPKKHSANATNETTFSTYIFIVFFCFHPLLCVLKKRQTQILSLINYTRKHKIKNCGA